MTASEPSPKPQHQRVRLRKIYQAITDQLLTQKTVSQAQKNTAQLEWLAKNFSTVAKNFIELAEYKQAAELFKHAFTCDNRYQHWFHDWFHALEHSNQLTGADQLLKKIIANDNNSTNTLINQCRLHYRRKQYSMALENITQLRTHHLNEAESIKTGILEGQVLDKMGCYPEAFCAYTQTNERVFNSKAAKALRVEADNLLRGIETSRLWYRKHPYRGAKLVPLKKTPPSPVFLVGFPRSGTTLLDQLLHSHSRITVLEERSPIQDFAEQYFGDEDKLAKLQHLSSQALEQYRQQYWAGINDWVSIPQGDVFIDKLPMSIRYMEVILHLFPDAKFLVSLRHPADVVLSNFMQPYILNAAMLHSFSLPKLAQLYASTMGLYIECRQRIESKALHEVRYETMINDVEDTARKAIHFLGLEWDANVLNYQQTADQRNLKTPSYHQVIQPIYKSSVNRWKSYKHELAPVQASLATLCRSLGYTETVP